MNELIDLRTLMFISGITSILLCLCMIYFFSGYKKTYAGFRQWAIAFSALAAGMVLLSQRNILPDCVTITGANLLLALFVMLLSHGLSAFAGLKQRNWLYLLSVVVLLIAISRYTFFRPDLDMRIIIVSGFFVIFSSCSAIIVYRDIPRVLPDRNWFLFLYFIFNGLWFFLRMLYTIGNKGILNDLMLGGTVEKITMVVSIEASIISSIGLIIIITKRVTYELFLANNEIKTLKGFIPICANCKKIRDDKGYWNQLETYIAEHTDAKFSHGICPECVRKLYPDKIKKVD
jgi:hypothetical protein